MRRLNEKEKNTMRIFRTILVGMILAVAIIPLPGHTASTPSPARARPRRADGAAGGDAPQTEAPRPRLRRPARRRRPRPAGRARRRRHRSRRRRPAAAPAAASAAKPIEVVKNGELKLKLNFQDAPVQTILEYLSETVGLTIVSSEPIASSRITVISRQPVTLNHALDLINSMLKEKGLTAILQGKTLKVVTLQKAPEESDIPVRTVRDPNLVEPSDSVATYIIPVSHITAAGLVQNLQGLLPEYAN